MNAQIEEKELYRKYLDGDTEAFGDIVKNNKKNLVYFIFKYVKDIDIAEDIFQNVIIYILENKEKYDFKYSFKSYLYIVAKSQCLNYLKRSKRECTNLEDERVLAIEEKMLEDIILSEQRRNKIIEVMKKMSLEYQQVLYLTLIEGLSYEDTSKIMEKNVSQVKNLLYRARVKIKKLLIEEKVIELKSNKIIKLLLWIVIVGVISSGAVYATNKILKAINKNNNITFNSSYKNKLEEKTSNNIWIGTFELAWQELAKKVGRNGIIELVESVDMVKQLNESTFSKKMLTKDDYDIDIIENKDGGYTIYAILNKDLKFIHTFDNFSNDFATYKFGKNYNGESIKYFGINHASSEKLNDNVDVLFYNKEENLTVSNDFAVSLKTREGDEIILYRTDEQKSFDEYYFDITNKTQKYTGDKVFAQNDELLIPYISINGNICYEELKGKLIKNSETYIAEAIQDVNFHLSESGCNLESTATMITQVTSGTIRSFKFTDTFVLFMREKDATEPYFALKVDNTDILEKRENEQEPQIVDGTVLKPGKDPVEQGEYKFYEDEKYEYYYPTQKTKFVKVFYKEGNIESETVEEALKNKRITMKLLDKYGVEYTKKEK